MPRHGLLLTARYRGPRGRYRVKKWPLFAPKQYERLSQWFAQHGRDLPWRRPGVSPWDVLVAEMLLRQTSAAHVAKVWQNLVDRYPRPADLVKAPNAELQVLLTPLGMARVRTEALKVAAQRLVSLFGGEVPVSYEELVSLPHVGPYTANAVRCFAHGIAVPVVDVNILRIFSRYFGLGTTTLNPHREPHIWRRASLLMPEKEAAPYQWALLDLAAKVCRPQKPDCASCPVRSGCRSSAKTR